MERKKCYQLYFFVLCVSVAVLTISGCRSKDETVIELGDISTETGITECETCSPTITSEIYVYVCGAVNNTAVYELPCGARVFEALELAGGMAKDADADAVNQAEILSDGQKLYIPYTGSEVSADTVQPVKDDGLVNINTADALELMTVSGIGETRANAVIAYREEHGSFGTIEDIMNVSGIKEGLFSKIKNKIRV